MQEILKVLNADFAITATSVRVPVVIGHSSVLSVEFDADFEFEEVLEILGGAEGIKLNLDSYATPIEVTGSDDVHIGRPRRDSAVENGLHLWLCSDNLRRGAATDAVEVVAEVLKQRSN
jgi:aspartate-semialdehyde dehydrogenase